MDDAAPNGCNDPIHHNERTHVMADRMTANSLKELRQRLTQTEADIADLRNHYLARKQEDHMTWLRGRIAYEFGVRCDAHASGCCVCEAWALYDALAEYEAEMAGEAAMKQKGCIE